MDIGRIEKSELEDSLVQIDSERRGVEYEFGEIDEVSWAYATSIQKFQGSEYPVVVITLITQHYMLLERNLIYTDVTRGKQRVVILAQPMAIAFRTQNHNGA